MNHHDTEHEDGLRRAMNIERMIIEMWGQFKTTQQYHGISVDDVTVFIANDDDLSVRLWNALIKVAKSCEENVMKELREVIHDAMHQLLTRDYGRIMNAKKEEAYEPTN